MGNKSSSCFSVHSWSDQRKGAVTRIHTLQDDRVCVIDFSNGKFQLLSDDFTLLDEIQIMRCMAVTSVDNSTLAVAISDPNGSDVIYYNIVMGRIVQSEKKVRVDGIIFDLAYKDGKFITRHSKNKMDYTYYGSKQLIKQKRVLMHTDCMYYDSGSDVLFLSNFCESTIMCYSLKGNVKWVVNTEGLPTGIVVVEGVVLVADMYDDVVHQLTMDGRLHSTPLLTKDNDLDKPIAIAYQHKKGQLLVSKHSSETVTAFDLSKYELIKT